MVCAEEEGDALRMNFQSIATMIAPNSRYIDILDHKGMRNTNHEQPYDHLYLHKSKNKLTLVIYSRQFSYKQDPPLL